MKRIRRLKKVVEAIRDSLVHWEVNLEKLILANDLKRVIETNNYGHRWYDKKTGVDIASYSGDACALCQFSKSCEKCPLEKEGFGCSNNPNSPWEKCVDARSNENIINASFEMVKVLEKVLIIYRKFYDIERGK